MSPSRQWTRFPYSILNTSHHYSDFTIKTIEAEFTHLDLNQANSRSLRTHQLFRRTHSGAGWRCRQVQTLSLRQSVPALCGRDPCPQPLLDMPRLAGGQRLQLQGGVTSTPTSQGDCREEREIKFSKRHARWSRCTRAVSFPHGNLSVLISKIKMKHHTLPYMKGSLGYQVRTSI